MNNTYRILYAEMCRVVSWIVFILVVIYNHLFYLSSLVEVNFICNSSTDWLTFIRGLITHKSTDFPKAMAVLKTPNPRDTTVIGAHEFGF